MQKSILGYTEPLNIFDPAFINAYNNSQCSTSDPTPTPTYPNLEDTTNPILVDLNALVRLGVGSTQVILDHLRPINVRILTSAELKTLDPRPSVASPVFEFLTVITGTISNLLYLVSKISAIASGILLAGGLFMPLLLIPGVGLGGVSMGLFTLSKIAQLATYCLNWMATPSPQILTKEENDELVNLKNWSFLSGIDQLMLDLEPNIHLPEIEYLYNKVASFIKADEAFFLNRGNVKERLLALVP